jgi:DNA polymerase-3 subunit gamma/tau
MSQLIYQKYRPKIWSEVTGQFKTIKEFESRSKTRSFPPVILLSGGSGTGKTTIARLIAKSISCSNLKDNGDPCNECRYCMDVENETFNLATYYYSAADLGIDEVGSLEEQTRTTSLSSKYKIFFIDEFQGLFQNTNKALDRILDILEKKYKNVYFILGTMDVSVIEDHKKGKAILNRASVYRLHDIDYEDIAKLLFKVCKAENVKMDSQKNKVLITLAEKSLGSLRTALSYLERCVFGDIWTDQDVNQELGLISKDEFSSFLEKLLKGDITALQTSIGKDSIEEILYTLGLVYKAQNGLALNIFEKAKVGNLIACSQDSVRNTIQQVNNLKTYNYVNKPLIDFTLVNCIIQNKTSMAPIKLTKNEPVENQIRARKPLA